MTVPSPADSPPLAFPSGRPDVRRTLVGNGDGKRVERLEYLGKGALPLPPIGGVFAEYRAEGRELWLGPPLVRTLASLTPSRDVVLGLGERVLTDLARVHDAGGAHGAIEVDGWGFDADGVFVVRPSMTARGPVGRPQEVDVQAVGYALATLLTDEPRMRYWLRGVGVAWGGDGLPVYAGRVAFGEASAARQALLAVIGRAGVAEALGRWLESVRGRLPAEGATRPAAHPVHTPGPMIAALPAVTAEDAPRRWVERELARVRAEEGARLAAEMSARVAAERARGRARRVGTPTLQISLAPVSRPASPMPPAVTPEPAAAVQKAAPEVAALTVETVVPEPVAIAVNSVVPEPVAIAVDSVVPEPVAIAVDTVVPEPVVVDTVVPEPVAVDAVVPEPVAVDTVVPEPVAVDTVVPEPVAVDTVVPEPVASVVDAVAPILLVPVIRVAAPTRLPTEPTPRDNPWSAPEDGTEVRLPLVDGMEASGSAVFDVSGVVMVDPDALRAAPATAPARSPPEEHTEPRELRGAVLTPRPDGIEEPGNVFARPSLLPDEDGGWTSAVGVTGSSDRAHEKGPGKWTESGRDAEELASHLPAGPSRPLRLDDQGKKLGLGWIVAGIVAMLGVAAAFAFWPA